MHIIFNYNPYSIVNELWSRRPTLNSNRSRLALTARPRGFALVLLRISYNRMGTDPISGIGGADRDRTDDPLLAKQVLSQLSYSPNRFGSRGLKIENPGQRIYRFANLNSQSIPWWA